METLIIGKPKIEKLIIVPDSVQKSAKTESLPTLSGLMLMQSMLTI